MRRIEANDSLADLDTIETVSTLDGSSIQPAHQRVNFKTDEDESTVPGEGCLSTLGSVCFVQCRNIRQSCHGSRFSKIKAFLMCITMPFYVLLKPFRDARATRRRVTHHGIVYFYILMSCTIVFNLWEQRTKYDYETLSYKFLQYFEAGIMVLSLIAMLYIAYSAIRGGVNTGHQEKNLILYFRTGLYVFGLSSLVYTALNIYNNCSCKDTLNIIVNISKFLFIVGQMLFLNYFYQMKLPSGGWATQVSLAHLLATNLSLWIWTLCKEVDDHERANKEKKCGPIYLGHTERYFYPLFVEYLLLVASMVYELWMDLKLSADSRRRLTRHDWAHVNYVEELESETSTLQNTTELSQSVRLVPARRRRKFAPSLAFSFVLGLVFSAIFMAFILAAKDSSSENNKWYRYFVIANICFYCTQIMACYVIKVCSQSQPANRMRSSLNLDDVLLYIGLAGVVIWEVFHFYGLLLFESDIETIFYVHGLLGAIEDIVQTVVLVSVRRLSNRNDKNARSLTSMALFLLATNLAFWVQNSFYIKQKLYNPGKNGKKLTKNLHIFANILNPIIIFFHFHSATCCYQMWVIFSNTVIIDS